MKDVITKIYKILKGSDGYKNNFRKLFSEYMLQLFLKSDIFQAKKKKKTKIALLNIVK